MLPADLTAADFASFPPDARATAAANLSILRELPLALAPFILRELSGLDWKLPAERRAVLTQLRTLSAASPAERATLLAGFRSINLGRFAPASSQSQPPLSDPDQLTSPESMSTRGNAPITADWLHDPSAFIEQLTAWLWSSHQTDRFREVVTAFAVACQARYPASSPPSRLGLVVIGQGAPASPVHLFARLRAHGIHLTHVDPADGLPILLAAASARAALAPEPYAHWYIDGAQPTAPMPHLTQVAYAALTPAREQLLARTDRAIASGSIGPESLRSLLAHLRPVDLGLPDSPATTALSHFQLSLLTEGSGTQIFATTFVQWAGRECIRRAEPQTLLLRFTPRQQAQSMDAMLGGTPSTGLDPAGSLVDADEAAWLTYLSLRRLPGTADTLRFLVWHEDQKQALVVGPGLPAGTSSATPMNLHAVLKLLA